MALLFLDSFDHYATADLPAKYTTVGTGVILAGAGRRGTAAFRTTTSSNTLLIGLPTVDTTVVLGIAIKCSVLPSPLQVIDILFGTSVQMCLVITSAGVISIYRGSSATLLGSSAAGVIIAAAYNYIELKAVINSTTGSVVVRVNEAQVLSLSGVNNAASATVLWNAVRLNGVPGSTIDFDDFYILDSTGAAPRNDFLGDCRVDVRLPTAQGNSHAWTPTPVVDNALNVDDPAPDAEATYNATTTVGATDTLVVQDAAVTGGTIFGLQFCLDQRKTDAGTCTIAPVVRHAGTDYPLTGLNPLTTYVFGLTPLGTNPGTGASWVEADFNAAEFGYKRTA